MNTEKNKTMDTVDHLNPLTTPLNQVCLIEASAGTGKTYTIGSLYLRLLLQAGEHCFSRPLNVQDILVVTFTEAATEELKGRIRERIHQAKKAFIAYKVEGVKALAHDPFLMELVDSIQDIDVAIQRLKMAEQTMDLAAIYTIHGFCRRMLMQYAFNSGIHFNLELVKDESELLERLFKDFWRENFYSQPLEIANYIHQVLVSPQAVLKKLRSHISHQLEPDIGSKAWLSMSLVEFLQQYVLPKQALVQQLKQQWLAHETELRSLIFNELDKNYKKGEKKSLKRTSFKKNYVPNWFNLIQAWARSALTTKLPETLTKYFSQQALVSYAEEGAEPISHSVFQLVDDVIMNTAEQAIDEKVVLYHYLRGVQQKLIDYKLNHTQKNFDDLLRLLKQALYSTQGDELAQFIRLQYPFAMIDEFQDTDVQQYHIFAKIYIHQHPVENGFIMIGDPKQAIYKFRGADIFTYFKAARQADMRFTLGVNWRSEQSLVKCINALFDFQSDSLPFLYPQIQFHPVIASQTQTKFKLHGKIEPALRCYIGDLGESKPSGFSKAQKQTLAQICAISIQDWLQSAQENQAFFALDNKIKPLSAERIAVIVRNWTEAELVIQALQQLGIASVYLSDRSNVFDCDEAKQLVLILTACLNPFSERHILNAIATRIFALTTAEISAIKQDEHRWTEQVERFIHYQRIWQKQGILAMLHQLFLTEKITEKLLASVGGERKTTDLLHLAELLQEASRLNDSAASLLRWFEKQIQGEDRQEGQQIRLESERQLVKIVTIHKSKGLEYDLVWLPFIADALKDNKQLIQTYYDSCAQQVLWDVQQQHQVEIEQEQRAEEMRLLYVALTRAKYQIALALPTSFLPSWNCLQYVLTAGKMDRHEEVRSVLAEFQQRMRNQQVDITIEDFSVLQPKKVSSYYAPKDALHYAEFSGEIEKNWQVTSFTAISAQHERTKQFYLTKQEEQTSTATFSAELKDYKLEQGTQQDIYLPQSIVEGYPLGYTPFDLPAGAQVGQILHQYFEQNNFNQPIELTALQQICQQLQLDQQWLGSLQTWLTRILNTPLFENENLKLADLAPQDCLKEMAFYLQFKHIFQVNKFNQLLQKYQFISTPLQLQDLTHGIQGMLRGFIDLVFRYQGKYYLLDYKSNKLGHDFVDYAPEQIKKVMVEQHYDWQYLFYTIALHRYLTQRDKNYHYERDFGGVIYTFLRGMNGKDNYGIYFNKPNADLIAELEELL